METEYLEASSVMPQRCRIPRKKVTGDPVSCDVSGPAAAQQARTPRVLENRQAPAPRILAERQNGISEST
jgi:hypothetical protein